MKCWESEHFVLTLRLYAVPVELDHIRDPAKVRGHEVFQVRSELPDAPLYR
ncbi:MAG: hypothetical protein LW816_16780 [Planctomyces sp.]|nr:hypothetical protein [Planctomyces sp.]